MSLHMSKMRGGFLRELALIKVAAGKNMSPREMLKTLKGIYKNSGIPLASLSDFETRVKMTEKGKQSLADLKRQYRRKIKSSAMSDAPYRERQLNYKIHKRTGGQLPYYDQIKGKGPKDAESIIKKMRSGQGVAGRMYGYSPKASKEVPIARGGSTKSIKDTLRASQEGKAPMYIDKIDHPTLRPGQTKVDRYGLYVYPKRKAGSSALYAHNRGENFGRSGSIMLADVPKKELLYHKGSLKSHPFEMIIPSRSVKRGNLRDSFARTGKSSIVTKNQAERIRQGRLGNIDLPYTDVHGKKLPSKSTRINEQIDSIEDRLLSRSGDNMGYSDSRGFYPKKGQEHRFTLDPKTKRYEYKLPRRETIRKFIKKKK